MTIIYQYKIATTSLGGFLKLLRAWKGSVYKLLYKELLIFLTLYASISLVYRFALNEDQRVFFESIVLDLYNSASAIPLSFVLGFYVTFIVQRWWQQFSNVPWPDRTLFSMSAYLHGFDDRARMMRRSVARYMLFGLIWICRSISLAVMKRFPTLDHIVDAGFITKEEKVMFENTECKYQKFFVPLMWANQILVAARKENKIETDFGLRMIIEPLADFRDKCSLCFVFDWITVPLVYTQVVTFATYSYFAILLLGQQYLDPAKNHKGFELDVYVPGFTILQFLFYMGWLKVAEQMINPFGEDDDDFDLNWLLDRHTGVAFALVDTCYGKYPSLVKDGFWNDVAPDVPYTESSARSMRPNFLGSTFNVLPPAQESDRLLLRDMDGVNQHEWAQRPRRKSSISGSLTSLLPFRSLRYPTDSQNTLNSGTSWPVRTTTNGKVVYYVQGKGGDPVGRTRWSSVEIPVTDSGSEDGDDSATQVLRQRAHTDSDFREVNFHERKRSLPFIFNPFHKGRQKKSDQSQPSSENNSPKLTRFTVDPVRASTEPTTDSSKARRSGQSSIPYQSAKSRMPALSAICESGNTVTSLSQLLSPQDRQEESSKYPLERLFKGSELLYVDETNPLIPNGSSPSMSPNGTSPTKRTSTGTPPTSPTRALATSPLADPASTAPAPSNNTQVFDRNAPLRSSLKDTSSGGKYRKMSATVNPSVSFPIKSALKKKQSDINPPAASSLDSPKLQAKHKRSQAPLMTFEEH